MAKFVEHEEFKKLNVGFAMDEGRCIISRVYIMVYLELYFMSVQDEIYKEV